MTELNILLVDDEERFLNTTKKLLEKRGYYIDTSTSGEEALEKIKQLEFQVIVLDVKMPKMDGITTLKKIKRESPGIEIIMLTGHATVENAVEGVRLGAANYLMKPVDIEGLIEKIEAAFSRRQSINAQTVRRTGNFAKFKLQLFLGVLISLLLPYALFLPVAYFWLNDTCQVFMSNRQLGPFYSWVCRNSQIITISLAIFFFLILIGVWFLVSNLIFQIRIMAEKRDELQFQLFHASKLASIGELASGVAHEINNPLAIVVARCGMIRDLLNPNYHQALDRHKILEELETISQASFKARTITRQLIDFGLTKEIMLIPCNVNKFLDEIIGNLKNHDFRNGKITIVRNYDHELPEILLDVARIKQVFLNILNNASDSILGSGTISIFTKLKNDCIEITIKDTGLGIAQSNMAEIFKPFYTTKQVGEGTGLSLSVSLSIVESHGGTIDVQSEVGSGSSFVISLPIYRE